MNIFFFPINYTNSAIGGKNKKCVDSTTVINIYLWEPPGLCIHTILLRDAADGSSKEINKIKESKCERMPLFETASLNQLCLSFY